MKNNPVDDHIGQMPSSHSSKMVSTPEYSSDDDREYSAKNRHKLTMMTSHLHDAGQTYPQHARSAANFGVALIIAGSACLVHAIFPMLFVHTASDRVKQLHHRMAKGRCQSFTDR